MNVFFNILIPTKNRSEYTYQTLKTIINQSYADFRVIVLDDSSEDDTCEMVENLMSVDSRVELHRNHSNLGMMDNFELGLKKIEKGYVIILGGDDSLLPDFFNNLNTIIKETDAKLITWPNSYYIYEKVKTPNAQLIIPNPRLKLNYNLKWIDSNKYLQRQADELSYVSDKDTPMIYVKGVAHIDLINSVKEKTHNGKFYNCSTPDGYSGIVLAGAVNRYLYCNTPLTMHGVSKLSTGSAYMKNDALSQKVAKEFFENAKQIKMHELLAKEDYSPLISIMTADFILTANDVNGLSINIDFKNLLSKAIIELEDGMFSTENINREVMILSSIAMKHGLSDYFNVLISKAKRNSRRPIEGYAISPNILYLNASELGLDNVFDAGYFFTSVIKVAKVSKFKSLINALKNSVSHKINSSKKMENVKDYINNHFM